MAEARVVAERSARAAPILLLGLRLSLRMLLLLLLVVSRCSIRRGEAVADEARQRNARPADD